ncbi:lamin tail domain-containing protein, partial [bacterium]|nr:lamin tail domain-containing protein [candidate division CSSED10-310 bacterium]
LLPYPGDGRTTIPAQGYALIVDPDYENVYGSVTGDCLLLTVSGTLGTSNIDPDEPVFICLGPAGEQPVDSYGGYYPEVIDDQSVDRVDLCGPDEASNWTVSYCPPDYRGARHSACGPACPEGEPIPMGALVITEVMSDPSSLGSETTAEFIEFMHAGAAGSAPIDLSLILLTDASDDDGTLRTNFLLPLYDDSMIIQPGQLALIIKNTDTDPYLGEYNDTICPSTLLLTTDSGSLTYNGLTESEPILLLNFNKTRIDAYTHRVSAGKGYSEEKNVIELGDFEENWRECMCLERNAGWHSAGMSNCASPPPPYDGPFILMAGFWDSYLSGLAGGTVNLVAFTWNPTEGDSTESVEILADGSATGSTLEPWAEFYYEGLLVEMFALMDIPVPPGTFRGNEPPIFIQLRARDNHGNYSQQWPFMYIRGPEAGCYYTPPDDAGATSTSTAPVSGGPSLAVGPRSNLPQILTAGYWTTDLSSRAVDDFLVRALVSDPLGVGIKTVELFYQFTPTGIKLLDDGMHQDGAAGDGIFGFSFPIDPWAVELESGRHVFSLMATTYDGRSSDAWPYLTVH